MNATDILERAGSAAGVRGVFGEPIERDGVTVVPVARIAGGGGGGQGPLEGADKTSPALGGGAGSGFAGRPVGAFVIRNGDARWLPAVDVNRLVLGAQVVALTALWTARTIARARARGRRSS